MAGTAFHEGRPNTLLAACFHRLSLAPGNRMFVPLCGKAHDLDWIAAQGCRVAGAELSRSAVEQAFGRMGLRPGIEHIGALARYATEAMQIYVGNIFDLAPEVLGPVDAIYDRAALVALPAEMRQAYAKHLVALTNAAPQLVITFEYDPSRMEGPPFPVNEAEVRTLYGDRYAVEQVATADMSGLLAERSGGGRELAWLLTPV